MNSVLKQIKPKLLEHYYSTEDSQSQVLVLQQQIDTLSKRVEVYRAEHSKLKERFEGGSVNDPAILEAQIRKTDQEIKDLQRHNAQQQIKNHHLIKHVQQQHAVSHHRVTIDDDSAYHMRAKTKKGELDRLRMKTEAVDREIESNEQTYQREKEVCAALERKIEEMSMEFDTIDGSIGSTFGESHRAPALSSQAQQAIENKCKDALKELQNTLRRKDVASRAMKLDINKLL